jgi:hypothetical protein
MLLATEQWVPPPSCSAPQCAQAVEAEMLIHELYWGASILPEGAQANDVPPFAMDNYPVTAEIDAAISAAIKTEHDAARIVQVPYVPQHLTPIYGKQEKDKVRIITDFSVPPGAAINDHTDNMHFRMMSHEDAYALMQPGYYMAKVDISKAYRTVGVHPTQWHLLAFKWHDATGKPVYYIDTRWPFGHAKAPELFCRITAAVRAMMAAAGMPNVVVYVDDFFIIEATQLQCEHVRAALSQLLEQLGFTENIPKRLSPAQEQIFLGLQYCTVPTNGHRGMSITVPEDKLLKAERMATTLAAMKTIPLKKLQAAVGYFNHIGQAVWTARAFTQRLIDALRRKHAATDHSSKRHTHIPVNRSMQLDLYWWARFARTFNGTAVVLQRPIMLSGFFSTDASDRGMGGFFNGHMFSIPWEALHDACATLPAAAQQLARKHKRLWPRRDSIPMWDIAYRELFALLWGHWLWGESYFSNTTVTAHNDNTTVEHDVNHLSSPNIVRMSVVRALCAFNAEHNIRTRVSHITTDANILADAASRLDTNTFRMAERTWRATVALTHPSWPGEDAVYRPRIFTNPGLMTHRAHLATHPHGAAQPSNITAVLRPTS